jgi:hypothetical protein
MVQEPSNSECYKLSSKPFRIDEILSSKERGYDHMQISTPASTSYVIPESRCTRLPDTRTRKHAHYFKLNSVLWIKKCPNEAVLYNS